MLKFKRGDAVFGANGAQQDVVRITSGWAFSFIQVAERGRQITAFHIKGDLVRPMGPNLPGSGVEALGYVEIKPVNSHSVDLRDSDLVRNATLVAWLFNNARREAYSRVAHLICELHARASIAGLADGDRFSLPLYQEHLGDALGLTAVHTNRMLGRLRLEGVLSTGFGRAVIHDLDRLKSLAGFDGAYLRPSQ
jgi:hypothetical protein